MTDPEEREKGKTYVGVHWYGRKRGSTGAKWFERKCKWELQASGRTNQIDAIDMDSIAMEIVMNRDGSLRKQGQNLSNINFYRNKWFKLSAEAWR